MVRKTPRSPRFARCSGQPAGFLGDTILLGHCGEKLARKFLPPGIPARARPRVPKVRHWAYLKMLAAHSGRVYTQEQILGHLHGTGRNVTVYSVNTHVANLRRKIESDRTRPARLHTVSGAGYVLSDSVRSSCRARLGAFWVCGRIPSGAGSGGVSVVRG
ncbi:helix-turn-helix domain-containing protein [Streptomyces sp. NPDC088354]|uniref:winged helix-turn-helix domain-containing protein n=1 Tax=Streptomyces sp. NPDC088354 TaxID=3365856 RepID=UPI00381FF8E9